jgi:hypothetical protein
MTSINSNRFNTDTKPIFFNACFDKTQVKNLVSWYLSNYGERNTIKFLEKLKLNGFHQATVAGISLGIEDLQIPPEKPTLITQTQVENDQIDQYNNRGLLTSVEKSTYLIDIWNQTSDKLRQTAIQNFKVKNPVNPVYMMAFSGARGNVSQVRQLIAMRGLMADPQGAILEFPIQSNFREGLTITEYLISCYGARKGLVDTALRTATSGYLTRRLVDSAQHAVVSIIDCQTLDYRTLEGTNLKSRLIGRVLAKDLQVKDTTYFRNTIISKLDAINIANDKLSVPVRSPLTCISRTSVCQKCYGWSLASGNLVQIGEAVGVIAAQSIGEPGTQLTMRTFHTGGVGVFSDQALKPLIAPYTGKINFVESLPGHFIRTPNGKIAFMLKYIPTNENKVLLELLGNNIQANLFQLTEEQLPPGSILFVKQGEIIQTKTLIGQASYIKVTKQQLPESSHPVYSPQTGQVFYESMNLIIEQQKLALSDLTLPKYFQYLQTTTHERIGLSETRRMAQIGSFWILKNSQQQNLQITKAFALPGDLVSERTTIGSYSFISPYNQYLHLIKNNLAFGIYNFQLPIRKILQSSNTLVFTPLNKALGLFMELPKHENKRIITWYPNYYKVKSLAKKLSYINFLYKKTYLNTDSGTKLAQGMIYQFDKINKPYQFKKPTKITCKKTKLIRYTTGQQILPTISNQISSSIQSKPVELTTRNWPILLNSTQTRKFNNQFISNDTETINFSIPKFNICLSQSSFSKTKNKKIISDIKWYQPNTLLNNDSNFSTLSNIKDVDIFSIENLSKIPTTFYKVRANSKLYSVSNKTVKNFNLVILQPAAEIPITQFRDLQKLSYEFLFPEDQFALVKQVKTRIQKHFYPKIKMQLFTKEQTGYYNPIELIRIQFVFGRNSVSQYSYIHTSFKRLNDSFSRGLTIYAYYKSLLKETENLKFETYKNNVVRKNQLFSLGNLYCKGQGEFLHSIKNESNLSICLLQQPDLIKIPIKNSNLNKNIGHLIRWGEEIETNQASIHSGQIIKRTSRSIIIRLGTPILASARGIVHVEHNSLITKNELIVTLKSRRLQTEDIVQGIPKIEQLFEARESQSGEILSDTVHLRLRSAFVRELELLTTEHWSTAVDKSFLEAQNFLVENIETAYSNQGVKISEKHIEVIVRQMTSRVRILEPGETGLLPGELVQHSWIKKFNSKIQQIGLREATYEPIVLGISKSVLQSDSFLLAASFQEVSRVLIKSALSKKRDFLQGLHENVIVGQAVPAGTGLISTKLLV